MGTILLQAPRKNAGRKPQEGNRCAYCKFLDPPCQIEKITLTSFRAHYDVHSCLQTRVRRSPGAPACPSFEMSYEASRHAR